MFATVDRTLGIQPGDPDGFFPQCEQNLKILCKIDCYVHTFRNFDSISYFVSKCMLAK